MNAILIHESFTTNWVNFFTKWGNRHTIYIQIQILRRGYMVKKILGISLIIVLLGVAIFNVVNKDSANEIDVTGNTEIDGAVITSPGSEGIELGEIPPEIELETLNGESFKLSELKGKKVILNFWATWCPPCKEEMPEMQEFYNEYKDEVEIIAINSTSDEQKVQDVHDYINQYNYTYTIPMDVDGKAMKDYNIFSYPTTYFIGTDGKVQQLRKIGPMTYEFMEEMVETMN